jgi:hypothetical protein
MSSSESRTSGWPLGYLDLDVIESSIVEELCPRWEGDRGTLRRQDLRTSNLRVPNTRASPPAGGNGKHPTPGYQSNILRSSHSISLFLGTLALTLEHVRALKLSPNIG